MPDLDEDVGWQTTRCTGWTVRDLAFHLLEDARRALVALHTPVNGPADVDAVTYWCAWRPGTPQADAGRRGTRIMASAWSSVRPIADLYTETATAVLTASREHPGHTLVMTQGHALTVEDLLSTLAVEASVHHLDLRLGQPSAPGLAEVRHVLDGLLGHSVPTLDDARYALVGTGREPLSTDEQNTFGAGELPLLG